MCGSVTPWRVLENGITVGAEDRAAELAGRSFQEQKQAHDAEAVAWGSAYGRALAPLGYELLEIPLNMEPIQRAWAAENGLPDPAHADPHGQMDVVLSCAPEAVAYLRAIGVPSGHLHRRPLRVISPPVSSNEETR